MARRLLNSSVFLSLAASVCSSQTVVVPEATCPQTAFRYKCIMPKGWERGSLPVASFLDGSTSKGQPVFHQKHGAALMTLTSIIDADGKVASGMIANYSRQCKKGLGIARERIASGELYAFFVNKEDQPIRAPLSHGTRTGPRHFATISVVSGRTYFEVAFSSAERDMVKDALKVAKSYVPTGK